MSQTDQKLKRKLTFDIPKFKFQNELEWTTSFFFGFFETNRSVGAHPPKNLQVFLQILNPVTNAEILAPELLGGQSEMVV